MNSLAELKKKYNRLRVVLSVGGGGEGSSKSKVPKWLKGLGKK